MFYKFNQFTQNLNVASQDVAMGRPITAQGFTTVLKESPEPFYDFKVLGGLPKGPTTTTKRASSSTPDHTGKRYLVPNDARYRKLMEKQTLFCTPDGKLVWQKLPKDMPLYYLAIGLASVGVVVAFTALKKLATPPTNE